MAMICRALLAARSPPLLSRWRVVLPDEAGTGLTPHRAAKLASERKRCTLSPAVRSNCAADSWPIEFRATRVGCEFIDEGNDHGVEIRDLVMQFEVSPSKRLQGNPVGRGYVSVVGQVRPPGCQGPDELHAGHFAQ